MENKLKIKDLIKYFFCKRIIEIHPKNKFNKVIMFANQFIIFFMIIILNKIKKL